MYGSHFSVIRYAVIASASALERLLFGSIVEGFNAWGFFSQ
jgi:hypothetical protein